GGGHGEGEVADRGRRAGDLAGDVIEIEPVGQRAVGDRPRDGPGAAVGVERRAVGRVDLAVRQNRVVDEGAGPGGVPDDVDGLVTGSGLGRQRGGLVERAVGAIRVGEPAGEGAAGQGRFVGRDVEARVGQGRREDPEGAGGSAGSPLVVEGQFVVVVENVDVDVDRVPDGAAVVDEAVAGQLAF